LESKPDDRKMSIACVRPVNRIYSPSGSAPMME
jgi:hypothetical protein